jgi:lipoate-protein ligase A
MNNIEAKASFSRKRNSSHNNPACFKALSYGEITVDGKKIIGSAQKRYINGFLQHGSILLSFNAHELSRVLGFFDGNKFKNIAALEDIDPKISCSDLMKAFKKAFEKELCVKVISDGPTKFELDLSRELERNKYSTPGWNLQR